VKLRWSVLLVVLVGLPAIFFGLTAAIYLAAAGLEYFTAPLLPGVGQALVKIVGLLVVMVMGFAALLTLAERKWSAAMQDRVGPNRANLGPFRLWGLPHFLADGLKLVLKEDFTPAGADKWLFKVAPALAFVPVFSLFAVVPAGPSIELFGQRVAMQIAAPDFGLLFVFAFASLAVYGVALGAWSSNNRLALLGGMRAASQLISYEVALGLSLVGSMAAFGTVRLEQMVDAQARWLLGAGDFGIASWGFLLQPLGLLLFLTAAVAESRRAPFDLPECENEIVGYYLEYSGLRFGTFMLTEFVEVVVLSGVTAAIFFGGHHLPFGEAWLAGAIGPFGLACLQGAAFWTKVLLLCWLQLSIRWSFPRFRYDQLQRLGWRVLMPAALFNTFGTAALVLWEPSLRALAVFGLLQLALLAAAVVAGLRVSETRPAARPETGGTR
jgi:NADH-quinone oxidoreductase subunit H